MQIWARKRAASPGVHFQVLVPFLVKGSFYDTQSRNFLKCWTSHLAFQPFHRKSQAWAWALPSPAHSAAQHGSSDPPATSWALEAGRPWPLTLSDLFSTSGRRHWKRKCALIHAVSFSVLYQLTLMSTVGLSFHTSEDTNECCKKRNKRHQLKWQPFHSNLTRITPWGQHSGTAS